MKRYREAVEYYEALETEARQTCTPFLSQDLKEQYLKAKNMMQYEVVEMEQIQKELMPVLLKPGATSCEYLETNGKFAKNDKLSFITDDMLIPRLLR